MYYGWLKVLSAVQRLTLAATLWWWAFWQPASAAALARSAHFEVYAQAGEPAARTVLAWFERLHAFFLQQTGLKLDDRPAVRVIAFASAQDYEPFRIRPTADAYYVGAPDRDWIVMTSAGSGAFRIAAHEYTHFVLRANGFHLPPWLNEGLAEFFSGVQAEPGTRSIGNGPAVRTRALRRRPWMPLSDLLTLPDESAIRDQADGSELFYAESWALTDMLLGAPEYAPRFEDLIAALRSGAASPAAVAEVYRRPIDEIARDLREWVARRKPRPLPLPPADSTPAEASEISSFDWHLQLAELRMATGRWDAAQAAYAALEREQPNDPDIPGALAAIALRKGDADRARSEWERASALGIRDAAAWYRYAVLAQEAGFTPAEVRAAFERAIALRPGFDDALFRLSQLENNAGRFASAVEHLREIRAVPPARQYAYWTAMAYALGELGRREEARAAAGNAETHAATAEQRRYAAELAEIAETDLVVEATHDPSGAIRFVHRRVPHNTLNWNPFIEPTDVVRRVEATLREIDCGPVIRLHLEVAAGGLTLEIPDPGRVQMRHAPADFSCGPQPPTPVTVTYAERRNATSSGIVRGLEFH